MPDLVSVTNYRLDCIIGCHPEERTHAQPVLLSFTLEMDTRPAAANDDLALSVDYDALSQCLATFAEHSRFQLLEALAGGLAEQVLLFSPLISAVTIRLDKPQALSKADCASVQIRRVRACSPTKK